MLSLVLQGPSLKPAGTPHGSVPAKMQTILIPKPGHRIPGLSERREAGRQNTEQHRHTK